MATTVLKPHSVTPIPVKGRGKNLPDRDFLFQPAKTGLLLGPNRGAYILIANKLLTYIIIYNTSELPVTLPRKSRLGWLTNSNYKG
jgi:hypothetical protein